MPATSSNLAARPLHLRAKLNPCPNQGQRYGTKCHADSGRSWADACLRAKGFAALLEWQPWHA